MGVADVQTFQKDATVKSLVSRRAWDIQFESGSAKFTPQTARELEELERQLEIAGGTLVEIHGHTDNVGSSDHNQSACDHWLTACSPSFSAIAAFGRSRLSEPK